MSTFTNILKSTFYLMHQ